MRRRSKKIIIIVLVLVIILCVIALGAYLFLTTDIFKSDEEVFFKYLAQNFEIMEQYLDDPNEAEMNTLKSSPYTVKSNISFALTSSNSEIANQTTPPRNFSIAYTKNADPQNDMDYSEAKIKYLTKELFTVQYIRNGDIHVVNGVNGITNLDIFNVYLGIENINLKQLAQKIGVQDVSYIPNQIEEFSVSDLLSLTDTEKEYIQSTLLSVVNSQISKDKFYHNRGVNITIDTKQVKTNSYGITLTSDEYQNFVVAILNEVSGNDAILNTILNKIKLVDSQTDITINTMKQQIRSYIAQINTNGFDDGIKIQVYESNGKIVRMEIEKNSEEHYIIDTERGDNAIRTIVSMNYTYEVTNDNNEEQTNTDVFSTDDDYQVIEGSAQEVVKTEEEPTIYTITQIEFAKQSSEGKNNIIAVLTYEQDDEVVKVSIQDKTEQSTSGFTNNIVVNVNNSNETFFTITSNANITPSSSVSIPTLTQGNYAILNNRTKEYLTQQLFPAIKEQLKGIYEQQIEFVKEVQEEEDTQNSLNEIDSSMLEMNAITNRTDIIE